MTTPAKIAANRANALRSTGPRTPDGKRRSSQNALKHGLTAERLLMPGELEEEYDTLREAYYLVFQPADAMEATLVDEIVSHSWRIRRVPGIEGDVLRDELARTAPADWTNPGRPHGRAALEARGVDLDDLGRAVLLVDQDGFLTQRLPRHERHLARLREDAIALLFLLQARRKRDEAQAVAVGEAGLEPALEPVVTSVPVQNEASVDSLPAVEMATVSPDEGEATPEPPVLAPAVGEG